MKSCQIPYDTLEQTLLSAYKSNFEKYKNLTSIIEDVLNLPASVPDEAKVHAVWYYAGYVHELANSIIELQSKDWNEGKYKNLHDYLAPFLTGEDTFNYSDILKEIGVYFSRPLQIEKNETVEERILELIGELKGMDTSSLGPSIDEIVSTILSNTKVLDPVSLDPNYSSTVSLLKLTLDELMSREISSSNITEINKINNIINSLVQSDTTSKEYVSLRDADGIGMYKGHEMYILRRKNGELYEVYYDRPNGKYFYYDPGNSLHEQEAQVTEGSDQVTIIYKKDNDHVVNPASLQLRIHTEELFTGLVIPEVYNLDDDQTVQEKLAAELKKGVTLYSSVKITASTEKQDLNAKRQARIIQNYPSLGRTIETEERPNQDASLKTNGSVVLTFYKPTSGFTITVSNATNTLSFDLDSYTNLAFLHSDNTVEPVDFSNPEHVELVKALAQVDSPQFREERYENITDAQIEKLKEAAERYKAFEKEVQDQLNETGFIDIKDIFFKYYDLNNITVRSNYKLAAKAEKSLGDFIAISNGELNANLQTYNEETNEPEGEPVLSKVAIILRKEKGNWIIENSIDSNQKIVAPNGKVYSSVEVYLEEEVVLRNEADKVINLKSWAEERFANNNAIYVSLKAEGDRLKPIAIPIVYQKQVTSPVDFMNFVGSMIFSLKKAKIDKDNTALLDFRKRGWGFDVSRETGILPEIIIHRQNGDKKVMGIRFTMLPNANNTEEMVKEFNEFSYKHLNIEFNNDILNKLNKALFKVYQEAGIEVADNLTLEEVMRLSEKAARKVGTTSIPVLELKAAYSDFLNDIRGKFTEVKNNHDVLLEKGKIAKPLLTENFRTYGLFDGLNFKVYKREQKTSNILEAYKKLETIDTNKLSLTYRDTTKKIVLPKSIYKKAVTLINPDAHDNPVVSVPEKELIDPSSQITNPTDISLEDFDPNADSLDNDGPITQHKIADTIEAFLTLSDEEFKKEISAMKALLPDRFQFTAEGFTNLKVEGSVLGYVKGLMIHLNGTLRAKGVAYHEGFHGVFRNILTDKQQKFYLQRVGKILGEYKTDDKGKYILVEGKKIYANDFRLQRAYLHLNDEQIKHLIYEEYLADGFAEYMETNKVPQTWMQKLFAWLKKMMNVFTAKGRIENLYYDIATGKFKHSAIRDIKSNAETVYSLYKGLPVLNIKDGQGGRDNQEVQSFTINELRDKMVYTMAAKKTENPDESIDAIYESAKQELLKEYQLKNLIDTNPAKEAEITKSLGNHYNNVRWLLGAFHDTNEPFQFINLTGNSKLNSIVIDKESKYGAQQLDVSKVAADKFKRDVIADFNSIDTFTDFEDILDTMRSEQKEQDDQETAGESYATVSAIGLPPNEGTAGFRKLFKYIPYDYTDPVLGVTRKRMVDSNLIFSTIRKITCNQPKEKTVLKLRQEIDRLSKEINHFNNKIKPKLAVGERMPDDMAKTIMLRNSLKAVFDTLHSMTDLTDVTNKEGQIVEIVPNKNPHVYIEFTNVMSTVDIKLSMLMLDTDFEFSTETEKYEISNQLYRINDIVIGKDINALRDDLVRRVRTINISDDTFKEVDKVLKELNTLFKDEKVFADRLIVTKSGMLNDAKFREYVDEVYIALSKFNLNIPYSVIHIGLAYNIYKLADKTFDIFPKNGETYALLQSNKIYFPELEKFTIGFFSHTLPTAVKNSLQITVDNNVQRTSDTLEKSLQRLATIYLNSVGEFILKYDPTIAGSVTRNAEGEMISKYCKPTPAFAIIQDLQNYDNIQEGLKAIIDDYHLGMESFFEDNPLLNTALETNRDFLKNFKVSSFAGFQQRFNFMKPGGFDSVTRESKLNEAVTFTDIDDKAFALSMMGLYSNMEEVELGKINYKVFKRILTVHEATSTSVVVDGLYQEYTNENGAWTKDDKGNPVYMQKLKMGIRQEYNLILKNFEEQNNEGRKKYVGYNINPEKDRGFTFNIFADFFKVDVADAGEQGTKGYNSRVALRQELIDQAKKGVSFEDAMGTMPELQATLDKEIKSFAGEQYNRFLEYLDSLGITMEQLPTTANPQVFLRNMFFNTWINAMFVNQVFDGPLAIGVKNTPNYFKRQKTGAASGDNIYNPISKEKTYRAAIIPKVIYYLDNNDLTKPMQLTPHLDENGNPLPSNKEVQAFDGQSINHINRKIKIAEAQGRLTPDVAKALRRMRYDTISSNAYSENVLALREAGIIFNSLKTVTASPVFYIKQSEHTLIRKDVSVLKEEYRPKEIRNAVHQRLDELYQELDILSSNLRNGVVEVDPITNEPYNYAELYQNVISEIHSYFKPIRGREILHNMLNSMELHDIDQLMDPNASKKGTVEPAQIDYAEAGNEAYYFNLNESLFDVSNKLTYLQLSTDKISKQVTQGIQQKLLLISQLDANSKEYAAIKEDIEDYQKGLADAVLAQVDKIKRVLVGSDTQIIARLYSKIADGLREQGAAEDVLQYFELAEDGSPIWDPNLPIVNEAIIFYYFSLFNKGVFDRKIDGRKYFHVSPFGFDVRENSNGRIITQDEYKSNPEKFDNVKTRPLSMIREEVIDPKTGETITKYVVEVMIPKELKKLDQKFVEQYLSTFFATRIPTEDKRSMVVCKVVDYLDEAYGNSIVVPFQVHMLSGSDFDIDALYAHVKSSYYLADGNRLPFGEYDYYTNKYGMTREEAEFMEYLHYISKDDAIADLVNLEMEKIQNQSGYKEEQAVNFGMHFGGKIKNYFLAHAQLLNDPTLKDNIVNDFKRVIATFNVLRTLKNMGLPASPADLKEYVKTTGRSPVVDVIFNKILQNKINILSNENVYRNFLANPNNRADEAAAPYKLAVERKGLSEKDLYNKQNVYTPTSFLVARGLSAEFQDCVGISASFSKSISMLATIEAELSEPVSYMYIGGKKVSIKKIIPGAVQLVGSSTGVFTDAPNEPYPAPLHLNIITDPIMLTMYSFGIPQQAAIMFQSLPPVVKAVLDYKQSFESAYSSSTMQSDLKFNAFLKRAIKDSADQKELVKAGVVVPNEEGTGYILNKEGYKLTWTDNVTPGKNIESFGYEVTLADGTKPSIDVQNFIILSELNSYLQLANNISFNITRLTDPMKGLRPDFNVFDNLVRTYQLGMVNPMFTGSTMKRLYNTYPVLGANKKALELMDKKSKSVFMERTTLMKGLINLFGSSRLYDRNEVVKNIKAFLGLQMQKSSMETSPSGFFSQVYLDLLKPENFLGPGILNDFNYLRDLYPNNEFIKQLVIRNEGHPKKGMRVLELVSSRLGKNQKGQMFNDFTALLSESSDVRQRAWRLGYYSMIKSGAQKAQGGYFQLLPTDFSTFMNKGIVEMRKDLAELDKLYDKVRDTDEGSKLYNDKLDEIIYKNFNGALLENIITDLIGKIVSINLANSPELDKRKNTIVQSKLEKKLDTTFDENEISSIIESIAKSFAGNIINSTTGAPVRLKIPVTKSNVKRDEIELFTPTDNKLKLTLNSSALNDPIQRAVLGSAGIFPYNDKFSFPIYVKNIYGQMLVLKYVDGKTLGSSFLESMKQGESAAVTAGLTAQYEVVPTQGTLKISPLAFSTEQATQINNMTSAKLQQLSSKKITELPSSVTIVPSTSRIFEQKPFKSAVVSTQFLNKEFGLQDGTTISVSDKYFTFSFNNGKLYYSSGEGVTGEYKQSLDYFAQALGETSWEGMKANPKFEDFFAKKSKLFVYNLVKQDPKKEDAPVKPEMTEEEQKLSTMIGSTIYELEPGITDEKIKTIYDNYVKLMGTQRKGVELDFEKFKFVISKLQVYKYKDTYIFGNYDTKNAVFITRINSSPTSKQLLAEALPNLVDKGLDFISFVPEDVAKKYQRSGYTVSTSSFATEFRDEKMDKYAAASNPRIFTKVFGKSAETVTGEEIEKINDNTSIEYVPVQINADLIKLAGKELSNVLEVYLSQFGIVVKDINEIKDELNIDEVGFADIVSKIAYIKDRKDLPPIAGQFIAFMMQHNSLVKDIIKELSGVTNEEDYKVLDKSKYIKIIGELIAKDLENKLKGKYSKSLLGKIKELLTKFFEMLSLVRIDLINQNVGIITSNIMQQNKKLITSSLYKPGAFGKPTKQVSLKAALESDPFGKSIIGKLSKRGFILTGSTSLGEQGDIQRPDENLLHDIDWVSPFKREETKQKFIEEYPDAIFVRDIVNDEYITDSYLIAPEGHSIVNYNAVTQGDRVYVNSYDVADKDGKIVGTYRLEKGENNKPKEVTTGVEGKVIDFFSYPTPRNEEVYEIDGIKLSSWKPIFKAKTDWARYKDIWDYNRFVPNENKPLIAKRLAELAGQTTQSSTSVKPTIDLSREWRGDLESRPVYTKEGVNTMRTSSAKADEHFGNPFSEAGYGNTIKVSSIGAAVRMYKDWLLTGAVAESEIVKGSIKDLDKFDNQRTWILDQINQGKLDGATLLYAGKSEARGQGMHPTALAEVVEQLRVKSTTAKPRVTQDNNSYYRGQLKPFKLDSKGNLILEPQIANWQAEISYDKYKGMGISMSPDLSVANRQASMFYQGELERRITDGFLDEADAEAFIERVTEEGYYVVQVDKKYIQDNFKDIFDNGDYEQRIGASKPIIIPKGKFVIENFTPDLEEETNLNEEPEYDSIPGTTTFSKNAVYEALGYRTIPNEITKLDNFENTIIEYVHEIGTHKDGRKIGARNINKGEKIQVVLSQMTKKYKEKAWTNPVNSEPLPEDAFKSFQEFMMFMYLHEKAHEYILKEKGETVSSYETRVNNEALSRLYKEFRRTDEEIRKAKTLYSMYLSSETGPVSVERFKDWVDNLKRISDKDIDDIINDNTCG